MIVSRCEVRWADVAEFDCYAGDVIAVSVSSANLIESIHRELLQDGDLMCWSLYADSVGAVADSRHEKLAIDKVSWVTVRIGRKSSCSDRGHLDGEEVLRHQWIVCSYLYVVFRFDVEAEAILQIPSAEQLKVLEYVQRHLRNFAGCHGLPSEPYLTFDIDVLSSTLHTSVRFHVILCSTLSSSRLGLYVCVCIAILVW